MPATAAIDVYQRDPSRLYIRTTTGDVQAWKPEDAVAISASFLTHDGPAHASYAHFMTPSDARSLAEALLQAADHVDALTAA